MQGSRHIGSLMNGIFEKKSSRGRDWFAMIGDECHVDKLEALEEEVSHP